jgi:hypothetical protein
MFLFFIVAFPATNFCVDDLVCRADAWLFLVGRGERERIDC